MIEEKEKFIKRLDGTFKKYESVVLLRKDVEKIQETLDRLQESGLRDETILILLQHHTKLSKKVIQSVLDGLQELPRKYFREE